MDSTLWIALLALVAGIVIGGFITRLTGPRGIRQRKLAQQLDRIQTEHTRYQAEVNEHFMETADLIRRLNDSYRDVHNHLAKGANRLCSEGDIGQQLEQARQGSRLTHEPDTEETMEPPRDYAPKHHQRGKGTLSEDYGLDEEDAKPETPERPVS